MQQSRQQQNDFMLPYKLANELQADRGEFASEDFINIVEAFQAAGSKRAQLEAFEVFKKLSNKDLLDRCQKICRLSSLLKKIQVNKR
jgi:hypothetical protein